MVEKRLEKGHYTSMDAFAADISLILDAITNLNSTDHTISLSASDTRNYIFHNMMKIGPEPTSQHKTKIPAKMSTKTHTPNQARPLQRKRTTSKRNSDILCGRKRSSWRVEDIYSFLERHGIFVRAGKLRRSQLLVILENLWKKLGKKAQTAQLDTAVPKEAPRTVLQPVKQTSSRKSDIKPSKQRRRKVNRRVSNRLKRLLRFLELPKSPTNNLEEEKRSRSSNDGAQVPQLPDNPTSLRQQRPVFETSTTSIPMQISEDLQIKIASAIARALVHLDDTNSLISLRAGIQLKINTKIKGMGVEDEESPLAFMLKAMDDASTSSKEEIAELKSQLAILTSRLTKQDLQNASQKSRIEGLESCQRQIVSLASQFLE
ncbi:hypothetical protein IFR05_005395 [Cadophora sp. M221]|nr:hypothetical protein IFR05_005395 [Cadophora sp. M221]